MEFMDISLQQIQEADPLGLIDLASLAGIINDERLQNLEDMRERLTLIKRKQMGDSRRVEIDNSFASMHTDNKTKMEALLQLISYVYEIFQKMPTDSLSTVLSEEGHISQSLPQELEARMKFLRERNSTVIIAGETNGGKSTFLNLLLGESILPTDVLHCTYSVCRITYAETYSVHTINYRNEIHDYPCRSFEQTKELLKHLVAREGVQERLQGSVIKEVMLKMPSPILKSGVTLVDTPGIGEDDQMDDVTMSFVKSTQASAFIYVIKSDTAGGVQEDRLLGFLRAIKQRYEADIMKEYFDPLAAMFVCHRWDNIDEAECEKVKQNALKKLEDVWPGFSPAQTFFFSTKSTMKHLPLDPDFITDSFYELLKGLKALFDRASYNAIKHQYIWLKHILQPASRHLRAMITHCIHGNEELEIYFQSLAEKQETLMMKSKENSNKLKEELESAVDEMKRLVKELLEFEEHSIELIDDYHELLAVCTQDNFLSKQSNRQELDVIILRSLMKYINRLINESGAVQEIEQNIVQSIEEHLGLFKCQIREIKNEILHGDTVRESRSFDNGDSLNQSYSSTASMSSGGSDLDEFRIQVTLEPTELAQTVSYMMQKRKDKKVKYNHQFSKVHEASQTLLERFRKLIHHDKGDPELYLNKRVIKICKKVKEDDSVLSNIVQSFVEWIQTCVNRATESIPRFIKVNTTLMDTIRVDRLNLQEDKEKLKLVMEELEPSRDHLKGFGSLYMEDFNAEMVDFALPDRGVSSVVIPRDLSVSARLLDDSGFQGSGSKHRKVKSLWGRLQLASITVDGMKEKVILKTYTYDLEDKHLFSEIACLRCLEDENIAQFFGMSRIRTTQSGGATFGKAIPESPIDRYAQKVSAFIFKGDMVSARIYASNKMICKKEFIPNFVHSLLAGLKYIHRERLVHMELNLDTVMVEKETGNVKLCQMCKPREARFPLDLTLVRTNSCICLSPSVLQGDEYKPTDDIYAFGLLLWELLFPKTPPYKEQKDWLLSDFIEKCNPVKMIGSALAEIRPSEDINSVIRGTVFVKRNAVCMAIDTIHRNLQVLQDDPAVIHLSRVKFAARRNSDSSTALPKQTSLKDRRSSVLDKPPVPERPPRITDAQRTKLPTSSASFDDHTSNVMRQKAVANGSAGRRNSEPAVVIGVMKIAERKGLKPEISNKVVGKLVKSLGPRRYSLFTESTTKSELHSFLDSNTDKARMTVRAIHHSRRLSLQDASLIVPKSKYPSPATERLDVPTQMEFFKQRYPTTFSSMKPNQNSNNTFSLPGRLIPSDSVPCLVPSVEEQKNSFFSKDEKLADSWQSPVMGRKSYSEGASSKSYSGKQNGLQDLPPSVYKAFGSASCSWERKESNRSSSLSSCNSPEVIVFPGETLWEDDTRPLSEDFSASKNTNNIPNASVSSNNGGSGLFESQNGFLGSSVSNRGKLSVSFKEQIDMIEPADVGASNRSSSRDFLVAYSQSSDDDELSDNGGTSRTSRSGSSLDSGIRSTRDELNSSSSANSSDYSFDSDKKENNLWTSHSLSNGHKEHKEGSNNDMTWSSYDNMDGMEENNPDEYGNASALSLTPGPPTGPSPSNDRAAPCPPPISKMSFNFK